MEIGDKQLERVLIINNATSQWSDGWLFAPTGIGYSGLRRLSMGIVEIAAMRSPPTSRGGKEKSADGD